MTQLNKLKKAESEEDECLTINRLVDLHPNLHGRSTYPCNSTSDLEIHINKHGLLDADSIHRCRDKQQWPCQMVIICAVLQINKGGWVPNSLGNHKWVMFQRCNWVGVVSELHPSCASELSLCGKGMLLTCFVAKNFLMLLACLLNKLLHKNETGLLLSSRRTRTRKGFVDVPSRQWFQPKHPGLEGACRCGWNSKDRGSVL